MRSKSFCLLTESGVALSHGPSQSHGSSGFPAWSRRGKLEELVKLVMLRSNQLPFWSSSSCLEMALAVRQPEAAPDSPSVRQDSVRSLVLRGLSLGVGWQCSG